jgi:hypothetical protein
LTVRETAVLALMAQNFTTTAIAGRLGCSPRTVETHTANLYRKMDVRDRLSAIRIVDTSRTTGGSSSANGAPRATMPLPPYAVDGGGDLYTYSGHLAIPGRHDSMWA